MNNRPPRPPRPFGKPPFPPKQFGPPKPFGPPPKAFKPKPVNPKPKAAKDHAAEAELLCRTISLRALDEHVAKLKTQLEIAERIRAERKVVEGKFQAMPLAELEAVVAAGVPGWELGLAQVVLNARKPKPADAKKKSMPPKPARRPAPPRPPGPGGPMGKPWRRPN